MSANSTTALRPPTPPGPVRWLKKNLFNTWYDALLTILAGLFLFFVLRMALNWALFTATWTPIAKSLKLLSVGQYPPDQVWRVGAIVLMVSFLFGLSWGVWGGTVRTFALALAVAFGVLGLLPVGNIGLNIRLWFLAHPMLTLMGYQVARLPVNFSATPEMDETGGSFQLIPRWIAMIGGALVVLGALLPWIKVEVVGSGTQSVSGPVFSDGLIILGLGMLALATSFLSRKMPGKLATPLAVLPAALAGLIVLYDLVYLADRLGSAREDFVSGTASAGIGLFIVPLGVLITLVGGLMKNPATIPAETESMARRVALGWVLTFVLAIFLLTGIKSVSWLPRVATGLWGGLLLTFLLALVGIVASFPIGLLLALGRQSSLPVVKAFCVLFIEMVRGVPLVTILFMSSIIMPLFLPEGVRIDRVLRAMIGMTLFAAAYMAENVRGGLQAIPRGQVEAARAVGLNGFQTMTFIVLPQALRLVIPAIVGQFIALFMDTTLALIVGLLELLSMGKSVLETKVEWKLLNMEMFIFVAVVFWVFNYSMSYASRRLEVALGVGER